MFHQRRARAYGMAVFVLLHLLGELYMQAACDGHIISDVKVYVEIHLSRAIYCIRKTFNLHLVSGGKGKNMNPNRRKNSPSVYISKRFLTPSFNWVHIHITNADQRNRWQVFD